LQNNIPILGTKSLHNGLSYKTNEYVFF